MGPEARWEAVGPGWEAARAKAGERAGRAEPEKVAETTLGRIKRQAGWVRIGKGRGERGCQALQHQEKTAQMDETPPLQHPSSKTKRTAKWPRNVLCFKTQVSTFLEEGRGSWKVAEPKRALVAADKKKTYPVCVLPAGVGVCGYVCV